MISRRHFSIASLAAAALLPGRVFAAPMIEDKLAALEASTGGRLGVAIRQGSGPVFGWRLNEAFPMCSTSKLLIAGAILARIDGGKERLDRAVAVTQADLLEYAPISAKHVGGGLTIAELCHAAITVSDNTAANLLLKALGGPPQVTAFARSIGDGRSRLDRIEPELNEVPPGDPRDSTTPAAMLNSLDSLILGEVLAPASRTLLKDWLIGCRTGDERLRAGLPKGWVVGDKTGTWSDGKTASSNDVAIAWPAGEGAAPVLITAYLTACPAPSAQRNAALAEVARLATSSGL